jgi:hypothetical protein
MENESESENESEIGNMMQSSRHVGMQLHGMYE